MFHSLKYAKILEEAGFTRQQAETSVKVLVEIMDDKFATKQDLKDLSQDLRHEMREMESRLTLIFKQDSHALESRLTLRMGAMFAVSVSVLTAVITFSHHLS
jgi:hypothetical protein